MPVLNYYSIELFDKDMNTIACTNDIPGLKSAKEMAKLYLNDPEYPDAYVVKVCKESGACVFDAFKQ